MIHIDIEILLIKDSSERITNKCRNDCIEVARASLPDKAHNINTVGQQLKFNRVTAQTTVSTFIVNQILNSAIKDCDKNLSDKIRRIYIICTNNILKNRDTYSKKTVRYFIKKQKENNDVFFMLSKNPITLLRSKQLGFSTKYDFM